MRWFWDQSGAVADWVSGHLPHCERGFGKHRALGVIDKDGDLVAGVIFHKIVPERGTIEISGASRSKRWLSRPLIQAIFTYAFDGAGCQMVTMSVSAQNRNSFGRGLQSGLARFGFQAHPIPRLFGRDEDGVIFTLTDDAWNASRFARRL